LALAWLTPAEQRLDLAGNSLLAVLHEFSREAHHPWLMNSIQPSPCLPGLQQPQLTLGALQAYPASSQHDMQPPGWLHLTTAGT
jgi:hypothetical protein